MAFKTKTRAVFVYGFAKNERDNIGPDEVEFWRRVASAFLTTTEAQLAALIDARELVEVICHGKDQLPQPPAGGVAQDRDRASWRRRARQGDHA